MRCSNSMATNLRSVHSENGSNESSVLTDVGKHISDTRARVVHTQSSITRQRHAKGEAHSARDEHHTRFYRQNGRTHRALQAISRLRQVRVCACALRQLSIADSTRLCHSHTRCLVRMTATCYASPIQAMRD